MCESIPAASIPPGKPPGIPREFEFLFQIFVGKCPALRSSCGGQMPGPPVHPISIQNYLLSYFNKHNRFNSIELHEKVTEWVTPTEKRQSKWFYCFHRSFMVDKCSSPTPKWQCLTAWKPRIWPGGLWAPSNSEMTTGCYKTSLSLFANVQGTGTLLTVKCPTPGTHRETNARGLPKGDAHSWNWLAHYL